MASLDTRKENLKRCVEYHGHLCMGQVLGVLIAKKGMELIGTNDPKQMIVISENDRCIADALQTLTGTRLGRRTFKLKDQGKMAATFINQRKRISYRVWVSGDLPKVGKYPDLPREEKEELLMKVLECKIDDVLSWKEVTVEFDDNELPGKPKVTIWCDGCGEKVMDGKHIEADGKNLCRTCGVGDPYYKEK